MGVPVHELPGYSVIVTLPVGGRPDTPVAVVVGVPLHGRRPDKKPYVTVPVGVKPEIVPPTMEVSSVLVPRASEVPGSTCVVIDGVALLMVNGSHPLVAGAL